MSVLLLGFLIGMRHALDADHLAAVAALATSSRSVEHAVKQGVVWGLGHTLTLFLFGSAVVVLDVVLPEPLLQGLELAVGVMLVILGADVTRRMISDPVPFHEDGTTQIHAHRHPGEAQPDARYHGHSHAHVHMQEFPIRALVVGVVHGMAGSGALILLTLNTVESLPLALLYMLLFGIGSIVGMALLSVIIALPLRASARGLTWVHNAVQGVIGFATVACGAMLVYEAGVF
jgi:hypothetical protein